MDYQGVLGRFTYDDGTDILNRVSSVEAGDYRENRDIKTPLQVLMDEKTERVVEKLLQTKGMLLPMASTVLHFYYPEIFPIIDQRAYRELYAMDYPKTMTKIPMLTELYLKYIKDCWEYQQEKCPEIAFSQIDKILYQLDKEKGNKVIY